MAAAQLRSLSAVAVVSSVVAVDAVKRIPPEYKRSFFGELDLWLYVVEDYSERLCEECEAHAVTKVFRGTQLRSTFEYLRIEDEDMIYAGVHPNCRCYLYRVIGPEQYLRWTEKLEQREAVTAE